MIFKLLSELSICELRLVFRRAGKLGLFSESRAIVQLTVYIVSSGQDPFTYRFPILESEVNTSDAIQVEVAEDSHLVVKVAAEDVSENVTVSDYEAISEVSPSAGGLTDDVSVVPKLMPGSECSVSFAKLEVSYSPFLEPEVSISEATLVEVAEDSQDLKDSGYELGPKCKTASEECSILDVLAVSSLVMKSTAESLFGKTYFFGCSGEHLAEPFVCTVDESNIDVKVEETVSMNLDRTKPFQLKNPCSEHWPPDLLIHWLYLVFLG